MFVVFEGIDGSGKTAVSNRVAKRLRAAGVAVEHVREEGEFASSLVRRLREFGKDARNLAMEPTAEMCFYLAREAQVLAELTRPALAAGGGVVFADRYLYTVEVLSQVGRGLPAEVVRPAIDSVAGGLWPDLVVLLDVDPHIARARRRASKIEARGSGKTPTSGGRKGLAGVGLQRRMREGYLALAARDPDRWIVIDNGAVDAELDATVEKIVTVIQDRLAGKKNKQATGDGQQATGNRPQEAGNPTERFFAAVEARAVKEPGVAAYLLAGLGHPVATEWRDKLKARAPHLVAYGLRGLGDQAAWRLREELEAVSGYFVARSIDGLDVEGERADATRLRLADAWPDAILATLDGNDQPIAWALRERLEARDARAVVGSLKGIGSERAWELRRRLVRQAGGEPALADPLLAEPLVGSLRGLANDEAWQLRRRCFEAAPVAALESLTEVTDEESWAWRARWLERAPRAVLRSLLRVDDRRAWEMRRRVGATVKESLDSMAGMGSREAWALREELCERWPSTAVKSLGPLFAGKRGRALADRALTTRPDDLSLLKHMTALLFDAEAAVRRWEDAE
jgi:dTMP kinase